MLLLVPSRNNPFKCHEEVLYLRPMIPPERFYISPPDWGILRRSRCLHIFPPNKRFDIFFTFLRPFFTRNFFQELFGLEGSKSSWEKKRFIRRFFPENFARQKFTQEKKGRILPAEESVGSKISWRQEEILQGNFGLLYNRTEISTR